MNFRNIKCKYPTHDSVVDIVYGVYHRIDLIGDGILLNLLDFDKRFPKFPIHNHKETTHFLSFLSNFFAT